MLEVAVIGGGPAGLRVSQCLAERGVVLFEQKRSVGRKFLVAGKSGLNLTNAAEKEFFRDQYRGTPDGLWNEIYSAFDNNSLRSWALDLGQETFVSSGKKVFPEGMKAAPLLRSLVKDINARGGKVEVQHSLTNIQKYSEGYKLSFETPEGEKTLRSKVVVLALGGASWSRTGSDGKWVKWMKELGIEIKPLVAANSGWEVAWPMEWLEDYEGTPWKNLVCSAHGESIKGEIMVTKYGLEGGPIYKLGHALRAMEKPILEVDFKPDFSVGELVRKAESVRSKVIDELSRRWKVHPSIVEFVTGEFTAKISLEEVVRIATDLKKCRIPLVKSRPVEEAISSAGGVCWSELDENLMLKQYPNIYVCGEMMDWEAPTGGFLLQGCLSSSTWVSRAVLEK